MDSAAASDDDYFTTDPIYANELDEAFDIPRTTFAEDEYFEEYSAADAVDDGSDYIYEYVQHTPKVPFYSETTHRADFIPKLPKTPKRDDLAPEIVARTKIPFYGETTNRQTYTPKEIPRTSSEIVEEAVERPRIPFDAVTTNQAVYVSPCAKTEEIHRSHVKEEEKSLLQEVTTAIDKCPAALIVKAVGVKARYVEGHWKIRNINK